MRISFSPQRRDDALTISRAGDVLTINSNEFDFAGLPDGATVPVGEIPCEWIIGPVERRDGDLHLTLILPHGSAPSQTVAFPEPIDVTADGAVTLPE